MALRQGPSVRSVAQQDSFPKKVRFRAPEHLAFDHLKYQKRQCFGRAKLDLLRKRLLLSHATVDQQILAK